VFSAHSLPEIPAVDPWWDLYMPAVFGDDDLVLDAFEAAEATTPLDERGDLYAIGARAFAVIGRGLESDRLAAQAFRFGGHEAEALATVLCPDGAARAERRMARAPRLGLRADAACDLAALRLEAGDVPGARAAIAEAARVCPGHAEAARWLRFFGDTPLPLDAVRRSRSSRRKQREAGGAVRDAADLLPVRRTGWLSAERYRRRVVGSPPLAAWAPAGTALGLLQDVGVGATFFALDMEYARLPAADPYVALELAADTLRACVDEGRDVVVPARALWTAACTFDDAARDDAAQLLAGLGTHDVRLVPVALEAVRWLAEHHPARATLWEGYRVVLLHLGGTPDLEGARALAQVRPGDALSWRMALEVIRAHGVAGEADACARAARSEPALATLAKQLLRVRAHPSFKVIVSCRLAPRWATVN